MLIYVKNSIGVRDDRDGIVDRMVRTALTTLDMSAQYALDYPRAVRELVGREWRDALFEGRLRQDRP